MGDVNPYLMFIAHNQEEKAAVLEPIKKCIVSEDVLAELDVNNVKTKKTRKQQDKAKSSPYMMRERNKVLRSRGESFHPFRRISPRISKPVRKSLEEESLADQTAAVIADEKYPRKAAGPIELADCVQSVDKVGWECHLRAVASYPPPVAASEDRSEVRCRRWVEAVEEGKGRALWTYPKKTPSEGLDRFKERVSKLSMWCGCMARVLTERISSIAIHPSRDILLIAAGGKKGSLGLWMVNPVLGTDGGVGRAADDSPTGIYRFEPHSGPISCTTFCAFGADRLITTSYDGTIRALDFEKLVFQELLSAPKDMRANWMQWHCQLSPNVLLASQGTGSVHVIDDRSGGRTEAILQCYDRSCRTISLHPLHPVYMATSSSLGLVSLWDLRKFGRKSPKVADKAVDTSALICQMSVQKAVSSAFFSPVTGSGLLCTSADERIRIYDTSKLAEGAAPSVCRVETDIRHLHKNSMWLSHFRATWHPQRDDAFVIGSLANPRRVEVYGRPGRMLCALGKDGHFPINTVCPVNAFHPNRMLLACADSGGRVHILL
ncbi:WD repeat-containing protein 76-like [Ischnura elegans]|uniref:WD repeat-containing protein 76-like n=1 Tax=Ischnura elegans TaxID=197161 RepID=UPI001ED8A79C|nr:WD repeat-containing protein 76-like [Ischnura elegans]XP_046396582.1 WD repeat-containing protein 76-like [Ischnura elegans]